MRLLIFIILIFVNAGILAQSRYEEKYFTGLMVKDLDASLAWYKDKLDFKVIDTVRSPNNRYRFALLSWNNTLIEMIEHSNVLADKQINQSFPDNAGTQGFFKLGFFIENLEEFQEKLRARNVKITYPILKAEGFTRKLKLFIIEDNEGNMIQFFNYL